MNVSREEKDKLVCRFYAANSCCPDGDRCQLPHVMGGSRCPDTVCRYFLQGNCSYGINCLYDHVYLGEKPKRKKMHPVENRKNNPRSKAEAPRKLKLAVPKSIFETATSPSFETEASKEVNVVKLQAPEDMQQLGKVVRGNNNNESWEKILKDYDNMFPPLGSEMEPKCEHKSKTDVSEEGNIPIQQFTNSMQDKMDSDTEMEGGKCLKSLIEIWKCPSESPSSPCKCSTNDVDGIPFWNTVWGNAKRSIPHNFTLKYDLSKLKVVDQISELLSEDSFLPFEHRRSCLYEMWKVANPLPRRYYVTKKKETTQTWYDIIWEGIKNEDENSQELFEPNFMSDNESVDVGTMSRELSKNLHYFDLQIQTKDP